ncbi:glycosyltransferase family 1 protein [Ferruginibacter paludis]|uniref:glycosyltransferase family 4 protein n=1 Tax=Ferruginibacter paludis TaxID=1310417 RepID=UPI0025B44AA1|nr:glycosyltransferase family 1 protein [Ferruginibacter paludis]MDN3656775.1 glycosyltransferase family 1 protein [Ferruginibacter paludis]
MADNNILIGMNGSMLDEKPTGVGVYSFNLINNLSSLVINETRKKITVFTPTNTSLNKNIKTIKLSDWLQSTKYGKLAAFCRFTWNTFYYPLQARKFDILISPTTHGSFLLNNQVIVIHDLLSLRFQNISSHQRFYFKYLLPALIKRARLIIAVSENTKRDIIHFFKCPEEKIKVIYNGYDDDIYFPVAEKKLIIYSQYGVRNYLLAVGPTYPHKNFELLIDAYNAMNTACKKKHPLVIAGGKEKYLEVLKAYVHGLDLDSCIHFVGYVPVELMPSLYREAHTLIFPSLYEGFGIPLLEAMASGCPVISSNTSSMPEVCGDAVLYFNPTDQFSLTASMQLLIMDDNLHSELKQKGLDQAKKFSWKKMAGSFNNIIDNFSINN